MGKITFTGFPAPPRLAGKLSWQDLGDIFRGIVQDRNIHLADLWFYQQKFKRSYRRNAKLDMLGLAYHTSRKNKTVFMKFVRHISSETIFVLFHELGHALHDDKFKGNSLAVKRKKELKANQFAYQTMKKYRRLFGINFNNQLERFFRGRQALVKFAKPNELQGDKISIATQEKALRYLSK